MLDNRDVKKLWIMSEYGGKSSEIIRHLLPVEKNISFWYTIHGF